MTNLDIKRKLAAILSADVEGYSRLMGEDEVGTIRTLSVYRDAMAGLIEQYHGRVVDAPGDNLLAEFVSVVDAVNCAVEIQRDLAERNQELPSDKRMHFRIGVNLGDVVEEKDRIYGDGINIAARMESLCEGGGVYISGTAYEVVENKLDLEFEDLGEHEVKNIAKPVRVYRVLSYPGAAAHSVIKAKSATAKTWRNLLFLSTSVLLAVAAVFGWHFYRRITLVETASIEKMAYPLPNKPSIAILPFVNMSNDPEQEYFSDGITESIITALSKIHNLFVIARNSTFTYKGKAVKIQQVTEELGVRYVLEGSVQKTEDRVRITAQLIDAIKGTHIWAERYDSDLTDIFDLQDEITKKIITSLHVKLTIGEDARLSAQSTENLEAYLKLLEGHSHAMRLSKDANILARQYYEEALALDPDYVFALVNLAWTHTMDASYGWAESRAKSLETAEELAQKALLLDDSFGGTYGVLGSVQNIKGNVKEAVALRKKAVALAPNSANYHALLGLTLIFMGNRTEEAIKELKIANRLDPFPPNWILHYLGEAYRVKGEYEKAIAVFKRAIKNEPDYWLSYVSLSACYGLLGREEEARAAAAEVLRVDPKFAIAKVSIPYRNSEDKVHTIEVLRKAGLPENPPLPLPDKPSIAVLPFTNMSDDPEQEYFSDGLAEDIITALSKIPELFVIARNSSFTYKGKSVKIHQIGRELGVKYVLEGSVRKAGNRVRITAQLIEATTDHHLWAERYDRDLKDIFALQDEITMKIITALRVQLMEGEHARASSKGTESLEAYLKLLQARELSWRFNKSDNALGRQILEEAIALDSEYANAYVWLAAIHLNDVLLRSSKSPKQSFSQVIELAQKALALDDSLSNAHSLLALLYALNGQYDKAIAEGERGVELGPNDEAAHRRLGVALSHMGRYDEAIVLYEKAIRFNPFPRSATLFQLGIAYLFTGRCEEAITACKKAVQGRPDDLVAHVFLTAVYGSCGREAEARATAVEVLRMDSQFSVDYFARQIKYKKNEDKKRLFDGLRKAGLE
jgi:TolB-like protein/class 3 adenylate cyclase/Flp pilus assembly protein TadD